MNRSKWLVRLVAVANCRARVFAFPFSGGSAHSYAHWRNWWTGDMELWAIEAPGRAARIAKSPISTLDEIVRQLVPDMMPLLDRPYILFGHSNGALMAFAIANRLLELGAPAPEGIILSGRCSPSRDKRRERVSTLPDNEFLCRLRSFEGTPKELLNNPEVMRLFFPAMRADFATGETYTLSKIHAALSDVPALVLAGTHDSTGVAEIFAWTEIFPSARTRLLEGGHFFINTDFSFPAIFQEFCSASLKLSSPTPSAINAVASECGIGDLQQCKLPTTYKPNP